jgi:hypothetical protein
MTNKITFSPRENGNFMSSILTCGQFLHRIPTIQRRRVGTYLSIEMSSEGEPLLMEAVNKILNPTPTFVAPRKVSQKG